MVEIAYLKLYSGLRFVISAVPGRASDVQRMSGRKRGMCWGQHNMDKTAAEDRIDRDAFENLES